MKISFFLLIIIYLIFPLSVEATIIEAFFQPDPLFGEMNYQPGDLSKDRFVEVTNYSKEEQAVVFGIREVAFNSRELLANIFISIYQQSNLIWSGDLDDLRQLDFVPLLVLDAGETIRYDFAAEMRLNSGNNIQGELISFDLWIGFLQGDGEVVVAIPQNLVGGGGFSGLISKAAQIINEGVQNIGNENGRVLEGLVLGASDWSLQKEPLDNLSAYVKRPAKKNLVKELYISDRVVSTSITGNHNVSDVVRDNQLIHVAQKKDVFCWLVFWFVIVIGTVLSFLNWAYWNIKNKSLIIKNDLVFLKTLVFLLSIGSTVLCFTGLWCAFWKLLIALGCLFAIYFYGAFLQRKKIENLA